MRVQMESNDGLREASSISQNFRCAGIVLSSLPSFLGVIYHRLAKWRRFAATRKEMQTCDYDRAFLSKRIEGGGSA